MIDLNAPNNHKSIGNRPTVRKLNVTNLTKNQSQFQK